MSPAASSSRGPAEAVGLGVSAMRPADGPVPASADPGLPGAAASVEVAALPRWLNHRLAAVVGVVLALVVALVAVGFLRLEREAALDGEQRSARLMARVLEDHVTRSLLGADMVLLTLAESLASAGDAAPAGAMLRHALPGQPLLRSVSLVSADGLVLASSNPRNEQRRLDGRALPPQALQRERWLGPVLAARDLADLAEAAPAARPVSAELILMVRRVPRSQGPSQHLVAALNPDALANYFRMATQDSGFAGMLFGVGGQALLAHPATGGAAVAMPWLGRHPVFAERLASEAHGVLVAPGALDGASSMVAFRASRALPVLAWVEKPMPQVLAPWHALLGSTLAGVLVVWVLIGLISAAAWRSLRARWLLTRQLARADARAVARERELRRLVDGVHEVLLRTDVDGRLTFVNQRLLELTGRLEAELLGQPLWDLVAPDDRPRVQALVSQRSDTVGHLTTTLLTDGPEAPCVELSMAWHAPGADEDGGYMGFAIDVSERERARRELRRQLEFSRTVLQVMPVPVFVKDWRGRCLAVNRAWEAFTGVSAEQVVGQTLDGHPGLASLGDAHRRHDDVLLGGAQPSSHAEMQLRRADGALREVVVTKIALHQRDGRVAGLVGSLNDVTEFLEAQRAMAHARDAAEASERVKSGFIANVSHELRTPLQSILGFSELALKRTMSPERVRGVLEDIHRSGERMLTLVNEVLDISKFDNTAVELALEPGEPAALVAEVVHELGPIAQRHGVRVEFAPPAQPLLARLNAFRYAQVLRNVLANALRFSVAGSTVRVEVAVGADRPHDGDPADQRIEGVCVRVIDQGPGVPPAELEAIFEPFTQSSRTGDGSGGTGLGLAIARGIMKAHGGSIWAHNRAEGGAVFTLWLPQVDDRAPQGLPQADVNAGAARPATEQLTS